MSKRHESRSGRRLSATEVDFDVEQQRSLLVGAAFDGRGLATVEASLEELALLAETAGAEVVDAALQRRDAPDPATFIGPGKVKELKELAEALDVDLVIFDDELSPAQQRNLEHAFSCDVVDRVALILDIFAQHASTQEGMVQVELAQHRYRLPRLRGKGTQMSRQSGGIGTRRGPGETQLEVDRRRILQRVAKLERELERLRRTRATQRKARTRRGLATVALVGYTNAGKSTLLNRLTGSEAMVQNQLFSTLDPTTRRLPLPGGETVLLTDTVGFVRKLPHQLVEAFRSTLEEVGRADLLLHVVDGAAPDGDGQIQAVRTVLAEVGADDLPEQLVVNKVDAADPDSLKQFQHGHPEAVAVSARTGEGMDELLETIAKRLRALDKIVELVVPYERGDVLAALHRDGEVLVEVHGEDGTRVRARVPEIDQGRYAEFLTG